MDRRQADARADAATARADAADADRRAADARVDAATARADAAEGRADRQLIFSGVTAAVAALAAWFTLIRHFGQTDADHQRRITESFSKAVEQLGSDKLEGV